LSDSVIIMRQLKLKNSILLFFIAVIFIGLFPFLWIDSFGQQEMRVYFFDVGQAESIYIRTPQGANILIDGGYDDKVIERLGEVLDPWDNTIDLMILTHPHDDHVTGLVEVARRFKVSKVIATGALHTAPNYLAWLSEIKERGIPMQIMDRRRMMQIGGGAYLEFIYPEESFYGKEAANLNNTSIALRLVHKDVSFFLGGDIEEEVERKILASGADLRSNVMKANHHGSDTSNTEEFIRAVDPEYCVITVGAKNQFGLPSKRVESRFTRGHCRILRTDLQGTIMFSSNGLRLEYGGDAKAFGK